MTGNTLHNSVLIREPNTHGTGTAHIPIPFLLLTRHSVLRGAVVHKLRYATKIIGKSNLANSFKLITIL